MTENHKSRSIVEPEILEYPSYIVEATNGKKIKIINTLSPFKYLDAEYDALKSVENKNICMLIRGILVTFVLGYGFLVTLPIHKSFSYFLLILLLLVLFAMLMVGFDCIKSRKKLTAFIIKRENGEFPPDMQKSINAYYSYSDRFFRKTVIYLLELPDKRVMDITVKEKDDHKILKIMCISNEGDVEIKDIECVPIYNIELECPQITILSNGVNIKFPMDY